MPRANHLSFEEIRRSIARYTRRDESLTGPSPLAELYRSSRPEDKLLLHCVGAHVDENREKSILNIVRGHVDWDYLLRKADSHRVKPLLYRGLSRTCGDVVPGDVLLHLHDHARGVAVHNLIQIKECTEVLKACDNEGIPTLVFKGPALGFAVYGDQYLRQFEDVDVLVRRGDFSRCKALLRRYGYRPFREMSDREERAYLDEKYAFPFLKESRGLVANMELHCALTHRKFPFNVDPHDLFERAQWIELGDYRTRTLQTEDLLLFLCVHGAKHYWQRLIWICDIVELLRVYPGIRWEQLFDRARSLGSLRMLLVGLHLAHHLFDAEFPPEAIEGLESDPRAVTMAGKVSTWILRNDDRVPPRRERARFHPKIRERLREKVPARLQNFHLAVAPSKKDREFVRLPTSLRFLYYVVRPVRSIYDRLRR